MRTSMACFTEVEERLPKGLDSLIKEKGVNLSGGEEQRLALTRGLLASADKEILLLDESVSSVDPATETRIYENVFREFLGKTIVASTHRMHMLPMFDRIFVFARGRLVGAGTLPELLQTCPEFVRQWSVASMPQPCTASEHEIETVA